MPKLIIPGPEGRIEARYEGNDDESAPIALILHPHPQHHGTMDNTVTFLMFHTFVNAGFNVLRTIHEPTAAAPGGRTRRPQEDTKAHLEIFVYLHMHLAPLLRHFHTVMLLVVFLKLLLLNANHL